MSRKEETRRNICRYVFKRAWYYFKKKIVKSISKALKIAWMLLKQHDSTRVINSKIKGVTYGNRQIFIKAISKLQNDQYHLEFKRVPNHYDSNAIAVNVRVFNSIHQIGFVSSSLAETIGPIMDAGAFVIGSITNFTGKHYHRNIGVNYEMIVIEKELPATAAQRSL